MLPDIPALGAILIIANYIALAASFLIAFFKPGTHAKWLAASPLAIYPVQIALFMFVFFGGALALLMAGILDSALRGSLPMDDVLPLAFIALVISIFAFRYGTEFAGMVTGYSQFLHGSAWKLPAVLLAASIAQEIILFFHDQFPGFVGYYGAGLLAYGFFVLLAGPLLDRLWPDLLRRHVEIVGRVFNFNNPSLSYGAYMPDNPPSWSPAGNALGGIFYCAWMLLRYLLFPMII